MATAKLKDEKADEAKLEKASKRKAVKEDSREDLSEEAKAIKKASSKRTKSKAAEAPEESKPEYVEKKSAEKNEEDSLKHESSEGMLIPLDDYVKSGIYLGTKVITPDMRAYVYKRRTDGLSIINTRVIDEKIKLAIDFISQYPPEEIVIVCKREAGWKALEAFAKATGIKAFTKKYPAGIITNSRLQGFFEPSLILIVDSWLDKNPIADANHANIPLVGICDTNNLTASIDLIVPGNNKSPKSIGLIFWLLARGYIQKRGLDSKLPDLKEFTGE